MGTGRCRRALQVRALGWAAPMGSGQPGGGGEGPLWPLVTRAMFVYKWSSRKRGEARGRCHWEKRDGEGRSGQSCGHLPNLPVPPAVPGLLPPRLRCSTAPRCRGKPWGSCCPCSPVREGVSATRGILPSTCYHFMDFCKELSFMALILNTLS